MKRSTKIITTIVLSVGIVGGAMAYGKHKYSDPGARAEYMMGYISDRLELDETQKQSLTALKDQVLAVRTSLHNKENPVRQEIRSMIEADSFDQAKALDSVNNKTSKINDSAPEIIAALGNFLDGLNAEQKTEILELMDHKRGRGRHNRHHDGDDK